MNRRSLFLLAPLVALLVVGVGDARADLSKKVIAAFTGKIVVSGGRLEAAENDKATIAKFKKGNVTVLKGEQNAEDAWEWAFSYTAFMKSSGSSTLKLEFYDGTKYVADKTLTGVDPKMKVLEGDISISEDDGLTKGHKYTLKLTGTVRGRDVTFAQSLATLDME